MPTQTDSELWIAKVVSSGGSGGPFSTVANPGTRVSSRNFTHKASESQSAKTMNAPSLGPATWEIWPGGRPLPPSGWTIATVLS